MNLGKLFKVFDTVKTVLDATTAPPAPPKTPAGADGPAPTFADQVETRLTNVVVAALREAFNRDEARLDLEREHLQEQRRQAEEARRLELRRVAAERELGRFRLVAGAAIVAWIAPVVLLVVRHDASQISKALLVGAAVLALCSVGGAFMAQRNVAQAATKTDPPFDSPAGTAALALLLCALALVAVSLLI